MRRRRDINSNCKFTSRTRRRGFTILIAMVLLTVLTGLSIAWANRLVARQRQVNQRLQATQAEWLATSALARARAKLAVDPNYTTETWQLTPAELSSRHSAQIEIRVSASAIPNSQQLEVVVDYPADPLLRHRVRRVQQVLVPSSENPS